MIESEIDSTADNDVRNHAAFKALVIVFEIFSSVFVRLRNLNLNVTIDASTKEDAPLSITFQFVKNIGYSTKFLSSSAVIKLKITTKIKYSINVHRYIK